MIDLLNQTIHVPGKKKERIIRWEVWFVNMLGTHPTFADARASADLIGQDPRTIFPMPVAISENCYEVSLAQGVPLEDISFEGSPVEGDASTTDK